MYHSPASEYQLETDPLRFPSREKLQESHYHLACVGGGFSACSFLIHLLDDCTAIYSEGTNIAGLKLNDMPRLPNINVTVFEPSESMGRGIAYRKCSDDEAAIRLTNGAGDKSTPILEDPEFPKWLKIHHPKLDPRGSIPRRIIGDFIEYSFDRVQTLAAEAGVSITIKHERCKAYTADRVSISSEQNSAVALSGYMIRDERSEIHGPFDAIVTATGHTISHESATSDQSKFYVHNGSNFEDVRQLCDLKPSQIVIAGFGATGEEVLLMLQKLNYRGAVLIASPKLHPPLDSINKMKPFTPKSFAQKYILQLQKEGRVRCMEGVAKFDFQALQSGSFYIEIKGETIRARLKTTGGFIRCSPYRDRLDPVGYSYNPFIRSLQDKHILPIFNSKEINITDEFTRAAFVTSGNNGNFQAQRVVEDIFMIGPPAINHPAAWAELFSRDAPKMSWGVAMHMYYRAWQRAILD